MRLIGIDADQAAMEAAAARLEPFGDRVTLIRGNFRNVKEILEGEGVTSIDGILFDLGLSSFHLAGQRGFSFSDEGALDMRMDEREPLTAQKIVNTYPQQELERILFQYGEEEKGRRIARRIVEERRKRPITSARALADLVLRAKPRRGRIHPATKTFQALRIEVNREVESLKEGMDGAIEVLRKGARIGLISFHSLEDRVVKERFRESSLLKVVTKKPIRPSREEVLRNPKSRSAKLRIAERE